MDKTNRRYPYSNHNVNQDAMRTSKCPPNLIGGAGAIDTPVESNTKFGLGKTFNSKAISAEVDKTSLKETRKIYDDFMRVNIDIARINKEIDSFWKALRSTEQIISKANANFNLSGIKSTLHQGFDGVMLEKEDVQGRSSIDQAALDENDCDNQLDAPLSGNSTKRLLHEWFINAPQDLNRMLVEQKYGEFVHLIQDVESFCRSEDSKHPYDADTMARQKEILQDVLKLKKSMVEKLKRFIVKAPNSKLWGAPEKYRRLKLLVALRRFKDAAKLFTQMQVDISREELKKVKASGSVLAYIHELSVTFFHALHNSRRDFVLLFEDRDITTDVNDSCHGGKDIHDIEINNRTAISNILNWEMDQMKVFVSIISRQMHLGTSELCSSSVAYFRKLSGDSSWTTMPHTSDTCGPFEFISSCLDIIFKVILVPSFSSIRGERIHDAQQTSILSYMMMPELRKLIELFVDTMISESAYQTKKETWSYKYQCKLISYNSYRMLSEENDMRIVTSIDDRSQRLYGNPLFDYEATASDQISLTQGKLITVLQKSKGWSGGIDENGKVGYFPTAYVQIVSTPAQYVMNSSVTSMAQQQEMAIENVTEEDIIPSYAWLQNITAYYLQEMFILFRMAAKKSSYSKNTELLAEDISQISSDHSYTQADVCELVDDIVSGLMKFIVNYFKLFETSVMNKINKSSTSSSSSISQKQIQNIVTVIDDLKIRFIPSLLRVVENAFKQNNESNELRPGDVMRIVRGKIEKIRLLIVAISK